MNKILEPSAVQERSAESGHDDTLKIENSGVGSKSAQSQVPPVATNRFNLPKTPADFGAIGQLVEKSPGQMAEQPLPDPSVGLFSSLSAALQRKAQHLLSDRRALGSMLLLSCIVGSSTLGGYLLGRSQPIADAGFTIVPASFNVSDDQAQAKPGSLRPADAQSIYVEKELTRQLGEMRSELLRLHSVFVQLAQLAELDDGEFDLQSPLLDWKEQSSLRKSGLLNRRIAHMSDYSETMTSIFNTRRMAYDQKISGRPLVEGYRSSGFGYRTDPITGERTEHRGLDFSGAVGEPILALADGVVTFSGKNSGYGNLVELEHVDGLRTRYAHNQLNLVSTGKMVKKGEPIATLGSTGRSTGPHVHIEVRLDGSPIDPGFFIR